MPLTNASGDLLVTNQLKIDMRIITNAQAWAEQVRGVYHLLYPHIVDDFTHHEDIQTWIDEVYAKHGHAPGPGCQGTQIVKIIKDIGSGGESQIPDKKGKGYNEDNRVLTKVKKGLSDLKRLVQGIEDVNTREL